MRYTPPILAGMEKGFVFLYQKCVHLGCRVPNCVTSQWFECPCHGSQYNRVGEKKGGPAPRGLDRFTPTFTGDSVIVDTSSWHRARSADRYQHDRPRGRGPALRRRARRNDVRCSHQRDHRHGRSSSSSLVGVDRVRVDQHPPQRQGRARLRDRARAEPQAVLRRRAARGSEARSHADDRACCSLFVIAVGAAAVLDARAGPAGERDERRREFVRTLAARRCSPRRPTAAFDCAGCHGGMKGIGGSHDLHPDRSRRQREGRQLARAGARTRCCYRFAKSSPTSSPTGRPFSPMPAWGVAGGGALNDQQIAEPRRLHPVDPDPAREL